MSRPDPCLDDRIPGAVNLRDLGGLAAGGRALRHGRLFRSGMTHGIEAAGFATLAGRYGVRTILDLRSDEEWQREGAADCAGQGIALERFPVYGVTSMTPDMQSRRYRLMVRGEYDWCERYQSLATEHADAFANVIASLLAPGTLPAILHCTAGRDRTGIAVALVLELAGVARADIVADYVRTGPLLAGHVARYAGIRDRMGFTDADMVALFDTRPEHMRRFLEWLEAVHGGARGYLARQGIGAGEVARLRELLLA